MRGNSLWFFAFAAALCAAGGCRTTTDALSLWSDGAPSKRAIVEYVDAVTDEKSPDFIPPERRIAVFDLDGTLFCETNPTYFDWQLFERRVLEDPTCQASEKLKSAARASREKGVFPPLGNDRENPLDDLFRLGLPLNVVRHHGRARPHVGGVMHDLPSDHDLGELHGEKEQHDQQREAQHELQQYRALSRAPQ